MSASKQLVLGEGVTLPLEAVTHSQAILAMRGAGKSNAGAVFVEAMYDAGLPWVVIDPKGDYWGLRSSADGTGGGLPVPILGGLHGDVPLESTAGHLIAELIVAENLSCVIDVSEFPSKAAQIRFLTDFAERIYKLHGRDPQPRHVVMEEAHDFIPQRVEARQAACVGAWQRVATMGRQRGLGFTVVSQRSATVNKDVLTQIGTLIAMRVTAPQDQKAIKDWVVWHGMGEDLVDSLPTLADGEAWVFSPQELQMVERVAFRRRRTFDSGATPKMGATRRVATMADIDLGKVRDELSEAIERAQAEDPKVLQRRIVELERELKAAQAQPKEVVHVVEREVAPEILAGWLHSAIDKVLEGFAAGDAEPRLLEVHNAEIEVKNSRPAPASASVADDRRIAPPFVGYPDLPRQSKLMLTEIARRFPLALTRSQLSVWGGFSSRSSQFRPSIKALVDAGFIDDVDGELRLTDMGSEAAGAVSSMSKSPTELLEMWCSKLPPQPSLFLRIIADSGRGGVDRLTLADRSGRSLTSSQFTPSLRLLVKAGLVVNMDEPYRAIAELLEAS